MPETDAVGWPVSPQELHLRSSNNSAHRTLNLLNSQHSLTVVWKCTTSPQKQNPCTVPQGDILGSGKRGPHRPSASSKLSRDGLSTVLRCGPPRATLQGFRSKKPSLSPVSVSLSMNFSTQSGTRLERFLEASWLRCCSLKDICCWAHVRESDSLAKSTRESTGRMWVCFLWK